MRILVVEDERKVASFLRQGLEEEGQGPDPEREERHDDPQGLRRPLSEAPGPEAPEPREEEEARSLLYADIGKQAPEEVWQALHRH